MNDAIRAKMAEEDCATIDVYSMPTYDNDNDLDRFIRCMGRRHLIKYRVALYHVTKTTGQQVAESTELRMIVATVEQKRAAIIKAMGWEGVTV